MNSSPPPREEPLAGALGKWINEICDRFEDAWSKGKRPPIEDHLGATAEPARALLLRELVLLDVHYRRARGDSPQAADYTDPFPTLDPQWLARVLETKSEAGAQNSISTLMADSGLALPTAAVRLPTILGFEVLGVLGRGGMGVVYQARQTKLNRMVALKMILAGEYASVQELTRFRREAEAAAQLQHPNIVQVFEVAEQDDRPYLVLEYVNGGTLQQRLKDTPWSTEDAARLIQTVARAIDYAHRHGVVHRDLKPGNILLQESGISAAATAPEAPLPAAHSLRPPPPSLIPKITDFGLAKVLHAEATHTRSGAVLGTPGYMAPEQAEGRREGVGPAADVYALGSILYELLTGRTPFKADTPIDTILYMLHYEPIAPSQLNPQLPRDLETICLKCLARAPGTRYPTGAALADDLERWLRGEPIQARPVGPLERCSRWCRRNPAVASLTTAVVGLLVVLAVGSLLVALWLRTERDAAVQAYADLKLGQAYLDRARAARWSGRPGRRFESLDALRQAARTMTSLEVRNEAIVCLGLVDLQPGRQWHGCPPEAYALVFDPQLERYVRTDLDGNLSLRRVSDDAEVLYLRGEGQPAYVLQFSPHGRFLAAKYHAPNSDAANRLLVWDLESRRVLLKLERLLHDAALDFSPDNRRLAVGCQDGSIRVYELAGGEPRRQPDHTPAPYALRFDPTGQRLAISSRHSTAVAIRAADTGRLLRSLSHPTVVRGLAWHPDGTLLATASMDCQIYLWQTESGALQTTLRGHQSEVTNVVFNRHGNLLASTAWDRTLRLWDVHNADLLVTVPGVELPGYLPIRFGPGDRQLAWSRAGTRIGLWDLAGGQEKLTQPRETNPASRIWDAEVSPDSRLLLRCQGDGVQLWDLATNHLLSSLQLGSTRAARFVPDDASLVTWGEKGLYHWPLVRTPAESPDTVRLGPPESLALKPHGQAEWASLSADGSIVAVGDGGAHQVLVIDLKTGKRLLTGELLNPSRTALSPDGRWLASGTWLATRNCVRIWDMAARQQVRDLDLPTGTGVSFTPDSRWLVTGTPTEYRFWEVGTWEPGRVLPTEGNSTGRAAFSREGDLLAINPGAGLVRLLQASTGRELATFPGGWIESFNRDGSLLVTSTEVWNLRRIRQRLAEMGLDWDLPPYPTPTLPVASPPLRVEVFYGELAP